MPKKGTLDQVLAALPKQYGKVELLEPHAAFELILWENAGYLVDDEKRNAVFHRLRREVGLAPAEILAAPPARIAEVVRAGGMQPAARAEKLRPAAKAGPKKTAADSTAVSLVRA